MECLRCHGLMVERACWEREAWQVSRRWARPPRMWSCLNCGNCLDRTIAFNRQACADEMTSRRHEKIWEELMRKMEAIAA